MILLIINQHTLNWAIKMTEKSVGFVYIYSYLKKCCLYKYIILMVFYYMAQRLLSNT